MSGQRDPQGDLGSAGTAASEDVARARPAVAETPWQGWTRIGWRKLRTALAAKRTVFAVIRTGLAIAGGGVVIVTILGGRWPEWLQAVLALGFVVPGYVLMLDGLSRYRRVAGSPRPRIPTITGWCRRG